MCHPYGRTDMEAVPVKHGRREPVMAAGSEEVGMLPLALKLRLLDDAISVPAGDDSYGLLRCQGFTVYGEDGRVGSVRYVAFGQSPSQSDALVVRTGLFFHKVMHIPTTQIGEICVERRRIVLRPQPCQDIVGTPRSAHERRSAAHAR